MLHITGQGKSTQEVGQGVSQREQLQPRLIILESVAGKLRSFDRVLSFFDPLFRRATSVVECNDVFAPLDHRK